MTLHYITLHYTTLHYITLHYITLHYITCYSLPWKLQSSHVLRTSWGQRPWQIDILLSELGGPLLWFGTPLRRKKGKSLWAWTFLPITLSLTGICHGGDFSLHAQSLDLLLIYYWQKRALQQMHAYFSSWGQRPWRIDTDASWGLSRCKTKSHMEIPGRREIPYLHLANF